MATSGTITGSFSGGSASAKFTYKCNWAIESQDVAARTSYVRFEWIVRKTDYAYRTWKGSTPWAASIDGEATGKNLSFDSPASYNNQDQVFLTTYATIQHNANGTKTAAISSTLDLSGTSAGTGNLSGNITLNAIPVTPPAINSFAVSDASGTQLASGVYVATKSIMRLTATATAYGGATIAKYDFYRDDTFVGSSTNGVYTATATAIAGEYVYKVIVTDSYGITATRTLAAVTVYPYSLPTITSTTTFRSNSSGAASASGTYASATATWQFASCGGHNTVTATATVNGVSANLTNGTASIINARLSANAEYRVVYVVTDAFGSEAKVSEPIRSAFKNFNLYPDNTKGGFAYGEAAQLDKGIFNVGEVIFRGGVAIEGSPLPITSGGIGAASAGAFFANNATQYRDQISLTHSAWGYRYGTVTGDGLLIIALSAQKTAGSAGAELVANICKLNGSTYEEYAIEQISSAGDTNRWTAINAVAVMKVTTGDKIRLGVYRWNTLTVVADTNILALGATVTLDRSFA